MPPKPPAPPPRRASAPDAALRSAESPYRSPSRPLVPPPTVDAAHTPGREAAHTDAGKSLNSRPAKYQPPPSLPRAPDGLGRLLEPSVHASPNPKPKTAQSPRRQ